MNARQFPKGLAKQLFWREKNRTIDALPYPNQNDSIDWDRAAAPSSLMLPTPQVFAL